MHEISTSDSDNVAKRTLHRVCGHDQELQKPGTCQVQRILRTKFWLHLIIKPLDAFGIAYALNLGNLSMGGRQQDWIL